MDLSTFFKTFDQFADAPDAVAVLRTSILQLAVTGKFNLQDHSDTPISKTLEEMEALPIPARYESRSIATIQGFGALSVGPTKSHLPKGWACVPLVSIARLESGHTPSRSRKEWWGGNVSWIGIADARVNDGRTIRETSQHTNADGLANSAARLLPKGTVCISRTASVGYVVVMGKPMATSQDFVN